MKFRRNSLISVLGLICSSSIVMAAAKGTDEFYSPLSSSEMRSIREYADPCSVHAVVKLERLNDEYASLVKRYGQEATLTTQIHSLEARSKAAEETLAGEKARNAALKTEKEQKDILLLKVQTSKISLDAQLAELTKIQAAKESEIESLKAQVAQKETEAQGFATAKSALNTRLAETEEQLTSAERKVIALEGDLSSLRKEMALLKTENEILNSKLEKQQAEHNEAINLMHRQTADIMDALTVLQKEYDALKKTKGIFSTRTPLQDITGESKGKKINHKNYKGDAEETASLFEEIDLDEGKVAAQKSKIAEEARAVAENTNVTTIGRFFRSFGSLFRKKVK
ncbi:MAG: hypothetical protein WCG05_00355 [Alphaproteobacteria bacterium]